MLVLLAASFLSGCAGTNFNFEQARKVQPGMTSADLEKIMGKPNVVTARGDQQTWVYVHVNAFAGTRTVSFVLSHDKVQEVPAIPKSFQ